MMQRPSSRESLVFDQARPADPSSVNQERAVALPSQNPLLRDADTPVSPSLCLICGVSHQEGSGHRRIDGKTFTYMFTAVPR